MITIRMRIKIKIMSKTKKIIFKISNLNRIVIFNVIKMEMNFFVLRFWKKVIFLVNKHLLVIKKG